MVRAASSRGGRPLLSSGRFTTALARFAHLFITAKVRDRDVSGDCQINYWHVAREKNHYWKKMFTHLTRCSPRFFTGQSLTVWRRNLVALPNVILSFTPEVAF